MVGAVGDCDTRVGVSSGGWGAGVGVFPSCAELCSTFFCSQCKSGRRLFFLTAAAPYDFFFLLV